MDIVKAPLRVSLFGGGTDLPEYYEKYGSTIISMAIDKHIYLAYNPRCTGGYRLSYSNVEELSTLTAAEHTIIRQAAIDYGDLNPCTLSIVADVPRGTGLGSSSALAVCVYQLFKRRPGDCRADIAHAAYEIERQVSNCGVQDHLPATFGGFNVYTIGKDGRADVSPVPECLAQKVDEYGLLLYTNLTRPADAILKTWKKSTDHLIQLHTIAKDVRILLSTSNIDITTLAKYLKLTWNVKRQIGGVVLPEIASAYFAAIDAGALAGKLLGAGGGGCLFFLVDPKLRQSVIDATGLIEIPFKIEQSGVRDAEL